MDLVVIACWWTWQLHNFGKVNIKVLTGQTVKINRWRDHRCHYGQLSWYWDEEHVSCRWSMICASSWFQSWDDDTSNSLLESTTSDSVQRRRFVHPCQSWPVVYRLMRKLQVRFTVVSENRSAAISMWFKSNTHIQPMPLLCPRLQVWSRVDVQNYISMVVIWTFIEIHNVQGYMWSDNVDALVGGTIGMVAAMSITWTAVLLLLLYWRGLWHTYTHTNSNVIPALSEL